MAAVSAGGLLLAVLLTAQAHDVRPGVIALRELPAAGPGTRFAVRLTPAQDGSGVPVDLVPRWPDGCGLDGEVLVCTGPLAGELQLPGLDERAVKVVVHVRAANGDRADHVITEGSDRVVLRRPQALGLWAYLRLGLDHILGGFDHLLFVAGVALLARSVRRVVAAITAFTVGHSLTLAAVALGVAAPPTAATELLIAASVLLMGAEAARPRSSLLSSRPWIPGVAFGLLHGLGFGGALLAAGLPEDAVVGALLAFNAGVELGQLVVLAALGGGAVLVLRCVPAFVARRLAAYAVGLPAGVWTAERAWAWASGLATG